MEKLRQISQLSDIKNNYTLNLFSDASIRPMGKKYAGSYEAIAVCNEEILDRICRVHVDIKINGEEMRGIRGSLRLALKCVRKYPDRFKIINIFSDSKVCIGLIRNFNKYRYSPDTQLLYTRYDRNLPLSNQSILIEVIQLYLRLKDLCPNINFYHQRGHRKVNKVLNLEEGAKSFVRENNMKQYPDLNLIRYISTFNNICDAESRSILHISNIYKNNYHDPVTFFLKEKITI